MAKIYMAEVGVELNEDHNLYHVYECIVNGIKRSLYDENIVAFLNEKDALSFIKDYVKEGVSNTYGVLWELDRKIEDHEKKELEENGFLEGEYMPRRIDNVYFEGGISFA